MKLTCPHCGEKNIDGTVCPACGQSLGGGRPARRAREYDSYAVGRRVLRLAPVWLLLMAAAVLLFFSWASRRGASEDEAFRNEATNQSRPAATPEVARAAASPLKHSPTPAATVEVRDESGSYSVQVGAFAELSQANEQVSRMRAAGFEARVVEAPDATRLRFQVRSGLYPTREEAARLASELRARGVAGETVVIEPKQYRER
ncbi:MAG TPA: SPOR domain-containing protein [Pyrinomonadaceae bacterium]|nr:SPOR domain-containing protein [Pyrinomonadaceae bacterium]